MRAGFVEIPQQLQRDGFSEQRRLMLRLLRQYPLETLGGGFGFIQMQLADAQAQPRVQPARIGLGGLFEEFGCFLPASQLLQANRHMEVGGGMVGVQLSTFA